MPPETPPPEPLLSLVDVAKALGLEPRTVRRLIDAGEFPRALRPSPGVSVWEPSDVQFYRHKMRLRHRLKPSRNPPPGKRPKAGE